jgi:hypothetical protein
MPATNFAADVTMTAGLNSMALSSLLRRRGKPATRKMTRRQPALLAAILASFLPALGRRAAAPVPGFLSCIPDSVLRDAVEG